MSKASTLYVPNYATLADLTKAAAETAVEVVKRVEEEGREDWFANQFADEMADLLDGKKKGGLFGPLKVKTVGELEVLLGLAVSSVAVDAVMEVLSAAINWEADAGVEGYNDDWDTYDEYLMNLSWLRKSFPKGSSFKFTGDFPEQYHDQYGHPEVYVPAALVKKHGLIEAFVLHTRLDPETVASVDNRLWNDDTEQTWVGGSF